MTSNVGTNNEGAAVKGALGKIKSDLEKVHGESKKLKKEG